MRVAAVLFDFGGVVGDAPFEALERLEQAHGAPAGTVRRINTINPDDNAWARIERGDITPAEFVTLFEAEAQAVGARIDGRRVLEIVTGVSFAREAARPDVLGAVRDLRARRIRVGLVTNNVVPLARHAATSWVFEEFDAVVESCVLGARKPEPAIYATACAALGCAPSETVLLDDLGINLKPARELGMYTIKVVDRGVALAELSKLLVTEF